MSLILEALKKSERQRRLGESPSLGSPVMAVGRRRSLMPALVVLIVLGLLALWWMRRESAAPVAEPEAPAAVATAPAPPAVPDASTFNDNPQPPPPVNAAREVAQSTAASRVPRSKVPPDATSGLAPDLRQKVKSGEVVVPNPQLLKPGQPATIDEPAQAAAAGADDAQREQQAAAAAMAAAAAAAGNSSDKTPVQATAAPKPAPAPAATAATPTTASAAAGAAPGSGVKLIWELPYETRRELPEIKLTMHVYADRPDQRFVIINGDRQVEGDEVGSLNLIEIRRDGVVFDYEGVRFLYPRGGR
ncbi:general secretion pathway protein GspB [Dokdonella sp.]|uniref:general secretion pathway protein GspB n=1 Tax=Dokdonella sp. TaxID=2291710 RepID=UPI003527490D